MTPGQRKKLAEFAREQLLASAHDKDQWSFAWAREGCVGGNSYCPWSLTEEWDFDGDLEGLEVPWSKERIAAIERNEADPNEEELHQWRRATGIERARSGHALIVWLAPVEVDRLSGYAVFLGNAEGAPEDPLMLEGIYDTLEQAKKSVLSKGVIIGSLE